MNELAYNFSCNINLLLIFLGRAGRVSTGYCFRMVTRQFYESFIPEFGIPEMKVCKVATSCIKYCFDWTINWKLFSEKYEMNSFSFLYIMKYGVGTECTHKFKNRLHIIILMWVIDWAQPSHWTVGQALVLCRVCCADSQLLTDVRGFICSVLLHFFLFFFQRCPLSQLILRVKLFDIGPPKAILNLALQPPDTDDIERTILLLKQVWDWFYHTIILGLSTVSRISTSCKLGCPDLSTASSVIFYEVGRV